MGRDVGLFPMAVAGVDVKALVPVSYTHLDVYKRQGLALSLAACGGGTTTDESPAPAADSPAASTETAAPESETPSYEPATGRVAYMPNLGSASSLFTACLLYTSA